MSVLKSEKNHGIYVVPIDGANKYNIMVLISVTSEASLKS